MGRRATAAIAALAALLTTGATALAGVTPGRGDHDGHTSQAGCSDSPAPNHQCRVHVFVNYNHRIKEFDLEWHTKCKSMLYRYSATQVDEDRKGHRIEQSGGKFSGGDRYTHGLGGGVKEHASFSYSGEFSTATKATGSFTGKVKITKNGNKIDQCNKTVDWHFRG